MLRAVKIRLYPNRQQQKNLVSQFGACRHIFNRSLALRKFLYKRYSKSISVNVLVKRIAYLKKRHQWLAEIDSQALQQSVRNMDEAYKNFFRRVKNGETPGFPRFKSRHHSRQTMQYPQRVKINGNRIYLPKIGWVKAKMSREIIGKLKTVTISLAAGQYHAAILVDDGINNITPNHNGKTIGLDVGIAAVISDSEGNTTLPVDLAREYKKLKHRQQQLSRKKRGSNNRNKAKQKLAKQHLKMVNIRNDFLHKISTKYSENQTIIVEDLKIKNMSKSAKGTVEAPGKNVKAKSGLNRAILQQAWGKFFELLEYKLERNGGQLIRIDPKHTSQTCSSCSHVDKESRKTQAKFLCTKCGHTEHADVNAAKNIRDRGILGSNASLKTGS